MMLTGFCVIIVAAFGVRITDCGVPKKNQEYIPIKYPGPTQEVSENRYGTPDDDVPKECQNQNFCTIKPPDYPQESFNKMLKGTTKPIPAPIAVLETVADRQGDPDEMDNCDSVVSYTPLYKVRSKNGGWRTVVQAPEQNYVQSVRLETCNEYGSTCFSAFPKTPTIQTYCEQKFATWEFVVAKGNNETEKIQSELPICCSCHYKFVKQ